MAVRSRLLWWYRHVFVNAKKKHSSFIEKGLKLLNNASTTIYLKKCWLFCKTINYLGHIIAPGSLHIVTKTTKATETLQYPTTVSKLRLLLKWCYVYRRFDTSFARIAALLNKKLKKEKHSLCNFNEEKVRVVNVFKIQTDDQSLRWTLQMKKSTKRLAQWRLKLPQIDLTIVVAQKITTSPQTECLHYRKIHRRKIEEMWTLMTVFRRSVSLGR